MKMLEDLAEVVRRADYADSCTDRLETFNALDSEANAAANFLRTHHATIRDMAARLEAAERDAARYRYLKVEWLDRWTERHTGQVAGCSFSFEGPSHDIDKDIDDAMRENGR